LIGATLEGGYMTLLNIVALLAGAALISAFYCQAPFRMRVLAFLSSVLFIWYAVALDIIPLLALSVGTAAINLIRLAGLTNSRHPTRKMWKIDRDVTDRVRDIQTDSRNSSAGIEF
jgi:hypothetical protein